MLGRQAAAIDVLPSTLIQSRSRDARGRHETVTNPCAKLAHNNVPNVRLGRNKISSLRLQSCRKDH